MTAAVDGISLPATQESVAEVGRRVVALGDETGLGPEQCYRLRLATEEIVANVVAHGYHGVAESAPELPTFEVRFGADPDLVWVCVVDSGRPFDPTAAAAPDDLDAPLSQRTPGGLGIHLVRSSLDEFRYRRDGRHNHVTLGVCRAGRAGDTTSGAGRNGGPDGTDGPDRG